MKKTKTAVVAAVIFATGITWVGSEETANIFESPGKKQTNRDFKPAPSKMATNFGTLEFTGGGFPVEGSAQKIYDEMDLQRATQAYMDFMPALSVYGIIKGQIRDFGFKTSSDFGVFADFMEPSELYLTGNDVSIYAVTSLDLKVDGPTVVVIPPGMLGTANDSFFKFLCDFGPTGPDKGKGGKFLFLPPGYEGEDPEGYIVVRSPSYRASRQTLISVPPARSNTDVDTPPDQRRLPSGPTRVRLTHWATNLPVPYRWQRESKTNLIRVAFATFSDTVSGREVSRLAL